MTTHSAPPRILYIDDDPINRRLVKRLLSSYGFTVLEAENGMVGLQTAQKNLPDLILMDIGMPGLDGYETTTRMRSLPGLENTPVVAITAHVTAGTKEMALAAGCDGYIAKPINVDDFPHQVIAYLNGQRDTISLAERGHYLGKYSQKLVEHLESKIIELEAANQRLQKIDKIKSDFITVAAHELKTPITLVYGYANLLRQIVKIEEDGPETYGGVGDLATRIYDSVYRLSDVINDILNVSLIDTDSMQLDKDSVNLADVINTVLQELDPPKHHRAITINTENLNTLPEIKGDKRRLRQVFWNVLSNAIKFTPDNGTVTIKGWVATATEAVPGQPAGPQSVIILVQDTGIGIAATEQQEIFERFYMVEDSAYHSSSKTAFKGGGIGLGLPIAKGIIEAHGGRIWVESRGKNETDRPGSKFFILLPIPH